MSDSVSRLTAENVAPPLLKLGEIARRLNVDRSAVGRWISQKRLRAIATPGGWRVDPRDLEAFLRATTDERLARINACQNVSTPAADEALRSELRAAGLL
jgi:excisionase family DNA binding protein